MATTLGVLMRKFGYGVLGAALILIVAEILGQTGVLGRTWPALSEVLSYMREPTQWAMLQRALSATVTAGLTGGAIGVIVGVGLAVVAKLIRHTEPGLDRFAALADAVPAIALAPFLAIVLGREATPVVLPALGVAFIVYIATSSGLNSPGSQYHDLFTVIGSSRFNRFLRVEVPSALPKFVDGLALSAPAMFLGATIGEWFGASQGLGLLLVSSMQNFQIELLWSAALLSVMCSLIVYAAMVVLQRATARRFL